MKSMRHHMHNPTQPVGVRTEHFDLLRLWSLFRANRNLEGLLTGDA